MFIFSSSSVHLEEILDQATWWIQRIACACFVFFGAISLFVFFAKSSYEPEMDPIASSRPFSLEKIGQGALALQGFLKKTSLPDLGGEVVLLARNPHAEIEGKKGDFLLYLKSSGAEYKATNGEQIFLSCDSLPGGLAPVYRFSDYKTPLWIKPHFTGNEAVLLEVGLFTLSKETGLFQEDKMEISLHTAAGVRKKKETLPFIEILEKAKVWGQDVILARFLQDKYKSFKDKVKLEIHQQGKRVFCFLGKGDFLRFQDGQWIPIESVENKVESPIAEVKRVTPKSIELEIWDPDGFCSFPIKLEATASYAFTGKSDSLPSSLKWKAGKQVSCTLGKRKHILKEGDWLVKGERGWRHLRRSADVEEYLYHKINGELFIFETLVKEQSKLVMKGFLVDEMRTQAWPFSSAVSVDAKVSKVASKPEKKQAFLKKTETPPTTYLFPTPSKPIVEGDNE